MSAKASAYAKALIECPNGELISKGEKLVLIVLADSHQDKAKRFTYPSIDTIAPEAMCDRRTCQRYMASLERKGVIRRLRPANQGRGMQIFYFFPAFDEIPEGWQSATLFDAPFLVEKGGKRAAEGRQKGGNPRVAPVERAQERELEPEQKQIQPPNPLAGKGEPVAKLDEQQVDAALGEFCDKHGFEARRLRLKLRAVMVRRTKLTGDTPAVVIAAMDDAWVRVGKASPRLFRQPNAREFFEQGLWLDANRWPWDNQEVRAERLRTEARVGSWG